MNFFPPIKVMTIMKSIQNIIILDFDESSSEYEEVKGLKSKQGSSKHKQGSSQRKKRFSKRKQESSKRKKASGKNQYFLTFFSMDQLHQWSQPQR